MRCYKALSKRLAAPVAIVTALVVALGAPVARAVVPAWTLNQVIAPTNLPPGGEGEILVQATNLGNAAATGATNPVVLADKLPTGVTATAVSAEAPAGEVATCTLATVSCKFTETLNPYQDLWMKVKVSITAGAGASLANEMSIVGGGAGGVHAREIVKVSSTSASFGVEQLKLIATNENGSVDTQAGSHPYQLTTTLMVNNAILPSVFAGGERSQPLQYVKDLHFNLPAGVVGNPQVVPQCTSQEFDELLKEDFNGCPAETALGVAEVYLESLGFVYKVPLFNLVPGVGEPARFGFSVLHVPIILDTKVRTGGDYGVVVSVNNISGVFPFFGSRVTFWGVPQDPSHNSVRGWNCLHDDTTPKSPVLACESSVNPKLTPFLELPTGCTGLSSMRTTVEADSWGDPGSYKDGEYTPREGTGEELSLDGCNRLPFDPSIAAVPDSANASTPTGLSVNVRVPQQEALNPTGLSPADVRDTTVTLPEGVQISPAGADGLSACSLEEIGLEVDSSPTCPEASKVGTVEIKTPLLPDPLEGAAYLAQQDANPFGSLVALYIVAEDPTAGVVVKFAGQVMLDPVTGRLVGTFENTPQLPFEELKLHFFGSARAPLTTPPLCGSYTTRAAFAPWSGNAPAEPSSTFAITAGPNGSPCANPRPFDPGFEAGSTNLQAGAFTPFTLTMSRPDADQTLAGLTVQLPPGLSGDLAKVPLCGEPQASTGECPEGSLIGHTVVSAGLGNAPFTVEGGKVFITGPYKGAPFGLSILNPAKAGPFDLGYVVVRAKVEVNPTTAALHIVSDPLPTMRDGIPLQIQHVNVTVDKPAFTFNPTSCNPMKLTGTMTSSEGASASVETPFQVTNCASLAFKPGFSVFTSGKPSRVHGTSLDVKLTYPSGAAGTLANIAKVKVELPKQLPSRLSTLQKACTETQFAANPEGCPAASRVGEAVATTPILAGGLSGPAYFVSHGGAAWPELIVVLKGEDGVTVDLHGETLISKQGITSSTFNTVPDVPVGSFELKLPQGPYSALTTDGNPCKGKLTMPTEFVAQNGATIHQNTKIAVSGCPKAVKQKAKQKRRHSKKKHTTKGRKKR